MRFGVAIPTCTEGMITPIPFAGPDDIVALAVEAERLGYDAVMGNDHLTTQRYVRARWDEPPSYYEPLIALTACAAATSRIGLMTGVIVLPMRDPILLAKQAATLDRFSHGRLILGVGVGAYREEMEATYPDRREAPRAAWMDESIQALRLLATERRVDFEGRWIRFRDVEMYPKPAQDPLPIYSAGNAEGSIRRAATWCQGWIPAAIGPTRVADGRARLRAYAAEAGRDPDAIEIAPQLVACIGRTTEEAEAHFRASQVYEHLVSLQASTLKGFDVSSYVSMNLIGSVAEVVERVERYREAGADHLSGLLFVGDTLDALREQVTTFATEVMPRFRD
ncbi:MAG: TIGR03619 family F420-dependent LLM class oxidoreductase [Chloroflexi bacterium]|nr:TIGR03619 family F420-dependent LLM class oxidoreductase [Chloroflexota bacterium]